MMSTTEEGSITHTAVRVTHVRTSLLLLREAVPSVRSVAVLWVVSGCIVQVIDTALSRPTAHSDCFLTSQSASIPGITCW